MTTMTLLVHEDSANQLTGCLQAELTTEGLLLLGPSDDVEDVLVPFGTTGVRSPSSNFLRLPLQNRTLVVRVAERFTDQPRLARDLAKWIAIPSSPLTLADYRLPRTLMLLALIPALAVLVPSAALMTGREGRPGEVVDLFLAVVIGLFLTFLIFAWSFTGTPGVRSRVIASLVFSAFLYLGIGVIVANRMGLLMDAFAQLPFGPGAAFADSSWIEFKEPKGRFTVEMPGKPEPVITKWDRAESIHAIGVETTYTNYTILIATVPELRKAALPPSDELLVELATSFMIRGRRGLDRPVQRSVTHRKVRGQEMMFTNLRGPAMAVRVFVVNGELYLALASGPRYTLNSPDVQRFFASLQFLTKE